MPNVQHQSHAPRQTPEQKAIEQISNIETGIRALHPGDRGDAVKAVQDMLNVCGAKLDPDGKLGPKTVEALKKFQGDHKLLQSGDVSTWTLDALKHETAAKLAAGSQVTLAKPELVAEIVNRPNPLYLNQPVTLPPIPKTLTSSAANAPANPVSNAPVPPVPNFVPPPPSAQESIATSPSTPPPSITANPKDQASAAKAPELNAVQSSVAPKHEHDEYQVTSPAKLAKEPKGPGIIDSIKHTAADWTHSAANGLSSAVHRGVHLIAPERRETPIPPVEALPPTRQGIEIHQDGSPLATVPKVTLPPRPVPQAAVPPEVNGAGVPQQSNEALSSLINGYEAITDFSRHTANIVTSPVTVPVKTVGHFVHGAGKHFGTIPFVGPAVKGASAGLNNGMREADTSTPLASRDDVIGSVARTVDGGLNKLYHGAEYAGSFVVGHAKDANYQPPEPTDPVYVGTKKAVGKIASAVASTSGIFDIDPTTAITNGTFRGLAQGINTAVNGSPTAVATASEPTSTPAKERKVAANDPES